MGDAQVVDVIVDDSCEDAAGGVLVDPPFQAYLQDAEGLEVALQVAVPGRLASLAL